MLRSHAHYYAASPRPVVVHHFLRLPDTFADPRHFVDFGPTDMSESCWASECPDIKNCRWRLNPVWQIYGCFAPLSVRPWTFRSLV